MGDNFNPKLFSELAQEGVVKSFSSCIDFTLLDARATERDVENLMNIAYKNKYYSVVVNPIFVGFAKRYIVNRLSSALKLATVIGFPLGNTYTKTKIVEAKKAIKDGADELDVCICMTAVKHNDYSYVTRELSKIVRISRKVVVKAIIETAYLDPAELEKVVKACIKARVDYIQTSTGYAPIGATEEVVEKICSLCEKSKTQVKAAGGIKSKPQADNMLRCGATRIGTSRIL